MTSSSTASTAEHEKEIMPNQSCRDLILKAIEESENYQPSLVETIESELSKPNEAEELVLLAAST